MKGKVEAKDFVSIGLDVQLQVDDVFFKEGARIKKGDILVKFSDYKERDLNSKMQELKQNLAVKNSQLRFLKNQYGEGADTTNDINNLTGEIKALEGELIKLNNESGLVRRAIISPIDGYIVKINALKGQYADSLTPVVVLAKIQDVKIVSEPVRENQLQYVNVGNTANISVINNNNSYEAILYKIKDKVKGTNEYRYNKLIMPKNHIWIAEVLKLYFWEKKDVMTAVEEIFIKNPDIFFMYASVYEDIYACDKNGQMMFESKEVLDKFRKYRLYFATTGMNKVVIQKQEKYYEKYGFGDINSSLYKVKKVETSVDEFDNYADIDLNSYVDYAKNYIEKNF